MYFFLICSSELCIVMWFYNGGYHPSVSNAGLLIENFRDLVVMNFLFFCFVVFIFCFGMFYFFLNNVLFLFHFWRIDFPCIIFSVCDIFSSQHLITLSCFHLSLLHYKVYAEKTDLSLMRIPLCYGLYIKCLL